MKTLYAFPCILAVSFAMGGGALAQGAGAFSYQKQWWPQAVATPYGHLGSGAAYAYAGPSGPDLWNDPRAWWPDYQRGSGEMAFPSVTTGNHR
jgi:hypothetical protein